MKQYNQESQGLALYFNTHYKAPRSLRGPCMVEFFGEGGAKYHTNLKARTHIHKEKYVSWHACLPIKNKDELLTDDGELISWNASFFISIRSCFLSSQCGSSSIIEPYSPYRFSRQFGFYQDVSYDMQKNFGSRFCQRTILLDDLHLREHTFPSISCCVSP